MPYIDTLPTVYLSILPRGWGSEHYVAWGPHKGTRYSPYGCGAKNCVECYPFTYMCAAPGCWHLFDVPVPNGEIETCNHCGFSYDPKTDTILQYPNFSEEMEN